MAQDDIFSDVGGIVAALSVRGGLLRGTSALATSSREPRRDAELLLRFVLRRDRAWVLSHPEAWLSEEQLRHFDSLLTRRALHEPMQYILGEQEFYGLRFVVTPDVLIPRPETELLIEAALHRIPAGMPARVLDVGTGSGAIAIAIKHARPSALVTAVDLSQAALPIAEANAEANGVEIRLLYSDLLAAVDGESFDLVVSNPPYIANDEVLEPQVGRYEPAGALFAGPSGLEIYERLIPQAFEALDPGGWLLLEIGFGQAEAVTGLLSGWGAVTAERDLQGIDRVLAAQRPPG